MQNSAKPLFAKALFLTLLTAVSSAQVIAQTTAEVDAVVQRSIDAKKIPAAGVAVIRDGKVVLTKGYGAADPETQTSANENTSFQIASVTKQLTAAGILLLVEDGKIGLEDALGKFVPDVPPNWSAITIRQLLNQTSGIPNYTEGGKLVSDKTYTRSEILGLVKDMPVDFAPGTRWAYSNTNYFLLGMVIEKVTGKSYPDFMSERIFKPLGMSATIVNTTGSKIKNAAIGYDLAGGKWQKAPVVDPAQPYAAGAIVSTPVDMAKWSAAVAEGKLLKKASWDEAFASGKAADGKPTGYGFGWQMGRVGETTYMGHGGGIAGFSSYHVRFPAENLNVVVLVNTTSRVSQPLALEIAGLYLPKVGTALAAQNAARNAAAIADADPETTKFLRGVFEGMVRGEGDPSLFDAEMQKVLFPNNIKQLKGPLGSQGPIKTFELLTAENPAGTKRRVYRATFETGMKVRVNFALDAAGKIAGSSVRPE